VGIAAGPDGNVWFVQSVAPGGIGRSSLSGTITEFSSGVSNGALGITPGPDGNLWFTEPGGKASIGRITTSGSSSEFSTGLTSNSQPRDIVAGPDGNLWFSELANPGRIATMTVAPKVTGGAASAVSEQSATLGASVGPNSQATTYRFEYGTTTAYGSQTSSSSAGAARPCHPASTG
jgi:streptogramin lyase